MRKYLACSIVIIIVISLFISSSQTYEQQSLIPSLQHYLPNKPFESAFSMLISILGKTHIFVGDNSYYHFIEYLLRKGAHFVLFGLLATGIFFSLSPRLPRFFLATFTTFLLACVDETHQYFTGGRTATFRDVILDMSGALVFLVIIKILLFLKLKKNKNDYSGKKN